MNDTLIVQKVWTALHKQSGVRLIAYNHDIPNGNITWSWYAWLQEVQLGKLYQGKEPTTLDWMEEGSLKQKLLTISLSELSDITNEEITQEVECLET